MLMYPGVEHNSLDRRVKRRMYTLLTLFSKFENDFFKGLYLNDAILYTTVQSYFQDLDRTKEYHGIENADNHKMAAYMIKWIVKTKPIQIRRQTKGIGKPAILSNELFALFIAVEILDFDINSISNKLFQNLLYIFRYRSIDCLALASKMYILEQNVKGNQA